MHPVGKVSLLACSGDFLLGDLLAFWPAVYSPHLITNPRGRAQAHPQSTHRPFLRQAPCGPDHESDVSRLGGRRLVPVSWMHPGVLTPSLMPEVLRRPISSGYPSQYRYDSGDIFYYPALRYQCYPSFLCFHPSAIHQSIHPSG